jgi:mersacidin/lichenicidin family type 2 lantibiotic
MLLDKVIRAWKDPEFRGSLSEEEQEALPENPAGAIELTDDELGMVAGGSYSRSQSHSQSNSQSYSYSNSRSRSQSNSRSHSHPPSRSQSHSHSRSQSRSYSRSYSHSYSRR